MLSGFLLTLIQMLVMTLMPEVVSFDFSETEEPSIFNSGIIAPFWYKALAVLRTITLFLIPVGIYLAVSSRNEKNT